MITKKYQLHNYQGFTIVELMIALSILSSILIMATVVMINIGALYTKGVNAANLQNTARDITADVSAELQFSGNSPFNCLFNNPSSLPEPTYALSTTCSANSVPSGTGIASSGPFAFCIGTTRYTYMLNREEGTNPTAPAGETSTPHVLWRDTMNNTSSCDPLPITNPDGSVVGSSSDGYEMVPDHMRLTRFEIFQQSPDIYTINVWMAYGDNDLVVTAPNGSATCNSSSGGIDDTQFCAESQITTAVTGRVY